jgi:DNA-3-methyladenine glycosylase II
MPMSKQQANISLSKIFKNHKSKKKIFYLAKKDKDLVDLFINFSSFGEYKKDKGFKGILQLIIEQQLSVASAKAIYRKLKAKTVNISPESFLKIKESDLKKCGLSKQKISYLTGFAKKCKNKEINFRKIHKMDDENLVKEITKIKGIGPWTAQCYMLASLNRDDVWPIADLGLMEAVKRIKGLKNRPSEEDMEKISQIWRPYRSTVANVLWASYD